MDREILNIVNRVLSEEITGRIKNVNNKIFESDVMKKQMCSECGGKMIEGECNECGYGSTEMGETLHGNQYRIDKNKNNRIDREDLKMLRSKKTTNKYSDELDENDCVECDKGAMYELDMNESTGDKLYFYESEMIDMIETIVLEEKKKSKNKPKGKSKNPIKLTKDNQDKSKKQNDDYIESVVKKMKGYLKDGSKGKYEMNPKHFPKGNGELEVMEKMAYIPSNAVKDYTDNYTAAGLENIDFKDGIKPNEEWMDDLVVGSSRTGNNPDWANAVETPVNQKRNQIRKDNLLSKLKAKAYNKAPQPVTDVTGSKTDKASKVLINLESIEDKKIISDIEKMKNLFQNTKKTQ